MNFLNFISPKYIELLYTLDTRLLYFINVSLENPLMDRIWTALSHLEREWWFLILVGPFILFRFLYIYRFKALKPLFGVGLAVALSDMFCYRIVKAYVDRPRPFDDPRIAGWVRHVGEAHGASFPSNHAANCFSAAVVLTWFFPSGRDLFYVFAILVGISRIALGVHYPSDVLAGAIFGYLVGSLVKFIVLYPFKTFFLGKTVSSQDAQSYNWRKRIRRLEQD